LIGARNCQPWYPATCTISLADDPVARLAELGIAPTDVDAIIATHFDFDHAGRYDVFGPLGTDVYVQRAHMASALSDPDRYDPQLWRVPGLRWRLLDGDIDLEPGLRLLRTDGHATGHQSLAIETDQGWVILSADAVDSLKSVNSRQFPAYADAQSMNASIDRLIALAAELDAPILFGHDPEQWSRITLSPLPFALA
jgi:N-acyl homoserine lactone hydrolase